MLFLLRPVHTERDANDASERKKVGYKEINVTIHTGRHFRVARTGPLRGNNTSELSFYDVLG